MLRQLALPALSSGKQIWQITLLFVYILSPFAPTGSLCRAVMSLQCRSSYPSPSEPKPAIKTKRIEQFAYCFQKPLLQNLQQGTKLLIINATNSEVTSCFRPALYIICGSVIDCGPLDSAKGFRSRHESRSEHRKMRRLGCLD